jgi:2-succinyl-6-hydroxy-2,4-cyclohexadiene-1-carboxylate synthase
MNDEPPAEDLTFEDLHKRLPVHGVELAWDDWGTSTPDAAPLLLCHGFSGSSHDFALHIPALAADRHVITLDHRGHGLSTKTHDAATYTIDQLVADLAVLIGTTTEDPIHLLGHSMGGRIALQLTLDHPGLVCSLILMDTSAWSFQPEDEAIREMMASFIDRYDPERGLPDLTALGQPEQKLIEETCPDAWNERKAQMSAAFDPYALKALGEALFKGTAGSLRDRLPELHIPVTVLCGELDHPLVDQVAELTAAIPGATSTIIEGAYHSPQLTHQAEWRAAVEDHLTRAR